MRIREWSADVCYSDDRIAEAGPVLPSRDEAPRDDKAIEDTVALSPAAQALLGSGDERAPSQGLIGRILEKGLKGWADDRYREKLENKIREQVLAELDLTEDDLSQMGEVVRQRIEQLIEDRVRERLRAALAEAARQQRSEAPPFMGMPG